MVFVFALQQRGFAVKKSALFLSSLACFALFEPAAALALDAAPAAARAGKAVPFGGAYPASQNGRRAQDIQRPSSTICALREQTRGINGGTTRQDASGKIHVFNDPSALNNRSGDIYADCSREAGRLRATRPATRATSAYNARTNTLKAASDGYINRSATSSMMPKKAPSMYDPATGTLKTAKRPNAYQIYQQ